MNSVVHISKEEYGEEYENHLLEQYKVVRGRIVDIINDRNTQNKYLLTILTALLTVPTILLKAVPQEIHLAQAFVLLAFPIVGAIISWHWIQWNRTFGEAIGAAYKLLKEMEVHLPAQPFTLENDYRNAASGGNHKPTTGFTILMAEVFFSGNLIIAVGIVFTLLRYS